MPNPSQPILSILIPTCNRAQHLRQLLFRLIDEVHAIDPSQIEVVIGDNASQDETPAIIREFCDTIPCGRSILRSNNVGPDKNFQDLVAIAHGSFFWMIGDDDLPRKGALNILIEFLRKSRPTLLYLPPIWLPDASDPVELSPLAKLKPVALHPLRLAEIANMQVAFISSWVVSREAALKANPDCLETSLYIGTYLVQLSWILPAMACPSSGLYSANQKLLTAALNYRGDYQVIRTFGIAFPKLLNSLLKSSPLLRRKFLHSASLFAFPSLIFYARSGARGDQRFPFSLVKQVVFHWARYPFFWILCLPALMMPPFLAKFCVSVFRRLMSRSALA